MTNSNCLALDGWKKERKQNCFTIATAAWLHFPNQVGTVWIYSFFFIRYMYFCSLKGLSRKYITVLLAQVFPARLKLEVKVRTKTFT